MRTGRCRLHTGTLRRANVAAALDRADRAADLERTNEQLAIRNRIVRHDVTLPVSEVEQAKRALAADDRGTMTGHIDHALDDAEHVVDLTDTVGDLVEVVSGNSDPDRTPVDIAGMVGREVERARAAHPAGTVSLAVEAEPTVAADEMLSSVFRNLLNNAVDHHGADEPAVEVVVTAKEGEAVVRVADVGPGVPDDRKEATSAGASRGWSRVGSVSARTWLSSS